MIFVKNNIKDVYVPLHECYAILSELVDLDQKFFEHLAEFLDKNGVWCIRGVEQDLTRKGIYIECSNTFDEETQTSSHLIDPYVNDDGLLLIAKTVKKNKDELIELFYWYQNNKQ